MISSKKLGRMVTADVDKALANINADTAKPDMKADDELKKATGPSRNLTRGEAFRLARMKAKLEGKDPSKQTFTYEGKTYHTRMAGEGAKRSGATRSSGSKTGSGSSSTSSSPVADFYTSQYSKVKGNAANIQGAGPMVTGKNNDKPSDKSVAKLGSPVNAGRSKGFLSRLFKKSADSDFAKSQERKYGKRTPLLLVGEEAREANRKQGTIGGKAKGGKIDGCAVRGKTRAMKKGK